MRHLIRFTFLFLTTITTALVAEPKWELPPLDVSTTTTLPADPGFKGAAQVGVDAAGNSYAVWVATGVMVKGDQIYGSTLPFGGTSWSTPQVISDVFATFPSLSVNASGHAIVVWNQSSDKIFNQVFYSTYDPATGSWSAFPGLVDTTISAQTTFPQVSLNAAGQAVAVWDIHDQTTTPPTDTAYAAYFNGTTWTLQQAISGPSEQPDVVTPTSDNGPFFTFPQVGMDAAGNAVAVWQRQVSSTGETLNTVVESSTFSSGSGSWSAPFLLAVGDLPPPDNLTFNGPGMFPQVSVNSRGNAVAVWDLYNLANTDFIPQARSFNGTTWTPVTTNLDGTQTSSVNTFPAVALNNAGKAVSVWTRNNDTIFGARRNQKGKWTSSTLVDNNSNVDFYPQVAIDADGQAVVVWETFDTTTNTGVAAAVSHNSKNIWSEPTTLFSQTSGVTALPRVATNVLGDTTAVWSGSATLTPTSGFPTTDPTVQSSTLVLKPDPARHFKGFATRNTFPMQTECIHILTWNASIDPNVIGYDLYAGNKLIGTFPTTGPFKVTIRDACCGESTTYRLVAFTAVGRSEAKRVIL